SPDLRRHLNLQVHVDCSEKPAAQFMAVFGPYAARADQVLERFDPAALASASALVAGADDEIPLRPEEMTA
ncbi:MAG: hypothetical protein ACRDRJ_49855, partial [Streptosporangiaceae bacterium]